MQPYTFEYELEGNTSVIVSNLARTHPSLYKYLPFNFVNIQAEHEAEFLINQDPNQKIKIMIGGGVGEASHINLWSWKITNLYPETNKIWVTVQKE